MCASLDISYDGTGDHLLSNYFLQQQPCSMLLYSSMAQHTCPPRPPATFLAFLSILFLYYLVFFSPPRRLVCLFVLACVPLIASLFAFTHPRFALSLRSVHPKQCALLNCCLLLFRLNLGCTSSRFPSHIDILHSLVLLVST